MVITSGNYYNIQRENCGSRGALWGVGGEDMFQASKTSEPAVECTNVPTQTDIVVDIEEISQEKVEQEEEQAIIKLGLAQYDSGWDESDGDSAMGESDFSDSDF